MKINNKNAKKKNTYFKFKVIAVVFVALIGFGIYGVIKASDYIVSRDEAIYMDGLEAGHLMGLEEGYNNAIAEDWNMLNSNPEIVALLKKHFPEYSDARTANAIIQAESKGKQTAVNKANRNGSIDSGFFQVNTIHRKKGETKEQFIARMHDLEENFKLARKVLDKQGLQAWSTYNNKAYLTYLK